MHEEKYKRLINLKERLTEIVETELNKGVNEANTKELGEIVDMIKDIGECIKYCEEAAYFESVKKAMEEYGENPNNRMGYDPWRYPSSGRFAPSGGGEYYGYTSGGSSSGNRGGGRGNYNSTSGQGRGNSGNNTQGRSGYVDPYTHEDYDWDPQNMRPRSPKVRYYEGENGSDQMMIDIKEMLSTASPELKKRIKAEISSI